eukprot:TRINITY_DN1038_c0_g5_i2.p1 TRINITY_DN1038_c0_g5~~TRINITY_DN1038_c0_g5_i2.p1  ORF type:complete len:1060 (-),score=280.60 TRINITY_DN1038_c0_g5_i2:117-3200(-)
MNEGIQGSEEILPYHRLGPLRILQAAWKRFTLLMILWTLCIIGGIATLVAGAYLWGTAASREQVLIDTYNAGITQFSTYGGPALSSSTFEMTIPSNFSMGLHVGMDSISVASPVSGPQFANYTPMQFEYKGLLFQSFPAPLPPFERAPESDPIQFEATFNGTQISTFSTKSLPLLNITRTLMSLSQANTNPQECANQGGYYDMSIHTCFTFARLSKVSIAMNISATNLWYMADPPGCIYPFTDVAQYQPWSYTNASSAFNIDVILMYYSDPLIVLSQVTDGTNSFESEQAKFVKAGRSLIGVGAILIGIATIQHIVLFATQKYWRKDVQLHSFTKSKRYNFKRPAMEKKSPIFWLFGVGSVLFFGTGLGIGVPLIGHYSQESQFTWASFVGLQIIIASLPLALINLLLFWSAALRNKWTSQVKVMFMTVNSFIMISLCLVIFFLMVKPWESQGTDPKQQDSLQTFVGIFFILVFFPLAIVAATLTRKIHSPEDLTKEPLIEHGSHVSSHSVEYKNPTFSRISGKLLMIFGFSLIFPAILFLVTILPPIWNVPFSTYRNFQSPFALFYLPIDANWINVKLYTDVWIFYAYLYYLLVIGLITMFSRQIHFLTHKSVIVWPQFWKFPRLFSSPGEIIFLFSTLVLAAAWIWFWAFDYSRISTLGNWERAARTAGHCSNLLFALLFMPVSRNSIWVQLFNVPWERALKYHRWLGVMTFTSMSVHLFLWSSIWWQNDVLFHNLTSIVNIPHADNWSIPMMFWTYLGTGIAVILAYSWIRRKFFEVFYYSHHFFMVTIFAALIHAWALWYFIAPGLMLYFIDRIIRYHRSSRFFQVESMEYCLGDYTKITLSAPDFKYQPGQYAFLNIPGISIFQWHPFTISSAPGSTHITFHIKNMGPNTFTSSIAQLAVTPWAGWSIVRVDGPYGCLPPFQDMSDILLISGGIGVTPMHSILLSLYQSLRYPNGKKNFPRLKKVYFIWTVRDASLLNMLKDTLGTIHNHDLDGMFELHLHVSGGTFNLKIQLEKFNLKDLT